MVPYGGPFYYPYGYVLPHPMAQQTGQNNGIQYIPGTVPIAMEYEGYLVPINPNSQAPQTQPKSTTPPPPTSPSSTSMETIKSPNTDLIIALLRTVLPRNLVFFIVNWGAMIMNMFSIVAFGGLMTTAICTLTPLCSISFAPIALGLRGDLAGSASNQTTLQRIRRGTEMLNNALVKFEQMQRDSEQWL